jgi:hypothetical protein
MTEQLSARMDGELDLYSGGEQGHVVRIPC